MKKFYDVILDEAGNIVPLAELYVRNNTTPFALVTLYSDNGVTTTANPVVSGADGYCAFWTADNTLKLEVYVDGELEKTITDYQHYDDLDAELNAIRGLTSAANKGIRFTGAGTAETFTLSDAALTVLDDSTVTAMATTLGMSTDGTLAGNSDTEFPTEKAVKTYVDTNGGGGFSWKTPVRVATTTGGTLASDFENGDTVDGIVLATGDRILIKDQAAATANGIYIVAASGAPTRATDLDAGAEFPSAACFVSAGTANHDTQWTCTNDTAPTLGVDNITFVQIGSGNGLLQASSNLSDVANAATAGSNIRPVESLIVACSDETTAITTGASKVTFRMPYAFTLTAVRASVTTAPTGSTIIIDINESGSTILSTKLTIDATEKTSTTAATPAVISDTALADDAEITIDFDQVGSTVAGAGVKVTFIGNRT